MRKTLIFLTGLLVAYVLVIGSFAAEPEKKAVAPAKKVEEKSGPKVTFSGDVQYRLRYDVQRGKDTSGTAIDPTKSNYSNRYAWNFKMKAKVNENMLIGLRLSNPSGYCTDNVADMMNWVFGDKGDTLGNGDAGIDVTTHRVLSIPEMYFRWNASIVSITGGIIPVVTNTVLDLVGVEHKKYGNAGKCPWSVLMNNSQTGLELGLGFVNTDALSFGFNTVTTVSADSGSSTKAALKRDQLRFIFSLPVGIQDKMFCILPVMHLRTNVYRSADLAEANHSMCGGLDLKLNPIKQLGLSAGFAVGGYKNDSQKDDAGYSASSPFGLLAMFGTVVKPGFGKAMVTFKFSNWKDREADPTNSMIHFDLKYSIPVLKLTLMPRMRIWHYTNSETDATTTDLRPELFFIGKF